MKTFKDFLTESSLIDLLNNPKSREEVEAIEDTLSSLRSYPNGDKILEEVLKNQLKSLFKKYKFFYVQDYFTKKEIQK